ncbi:Esterase E4 [Pseudolycoriella hygida]|uniref:Esterase E4 n=1 Tax=Pseudolycoriella hygida TaxID=35572 RepID=A0A9Q0S1L2_9DIPT|nr:Esterase E4 [Pseudolycoriella hygida]
MKSKLNVFVNIIIACGCLYVASGRIVEIENGLIEGKKMVTRSGLSFYGFLGIPFAEPPLDDLRFREPVPKKRWDGILNCTAFGPMCMQPGEELSRSEDCLYLNVFTKNLSSNELKPVIAFIHGGGFSTGTAMIQGPEYLLDRDIVFVTFQYRLGSLGFMALETPEVSGNQGFKDQSLALKWIQKNIHHFAGDRNRVTLSGFSAGSLSVTAHMISPMSQGLFHNVIGVSGSIASQIQPVSNNIPFTKEVAVRVNCTVESIENMLDCLKNTHGEDIVKAENKVFTNFPCVMYTWWTPWVVEPELGQERFIIDDPNLLFREGQFSKVNAIMGLTANEFIEPATLLYDANATAYLNENWEEIAPTCFYFEGTEFTSSKEMAKILKKSYFPYHTIDIRSFNNLNNLFADSIIGFGVHKFVHLVNKFIDVYYYKFSYIGQSSFFYHPRNFPFGANHGDDTLYVLNYGWQEIDLEHPDGVIVERMSRIWEQFAWSGNPNNQTKEYLQDMIWPKHDDSTEWYLDIGKHLVEKNGLFLERFTVWDSFEKNVSLIFT